MYVLPRPFADPNLDSFYQAPVSLAGALQEYLDDPNFEQNRLEYRANGRSADKAAKTNGAETKRMDIRYILICSGLTP